MQDSKTQGLAYLIQECFCRFTLHVILPDSVICLAMIGPITVEARANNINIEKCVSSMIQYVLQISATAIIKLNLTECSNQNTRLDLLSYPINFDAIQAQTHLDTIHKKINSNSIQIFSKLENIILRSTFAQMKIKKRGIKNPYQKLSSLFSTSEDLDIISEAIRPAMKAHNIE